MGKAIFITEIDNFCYLGAMLLQIQRHLNIILIIFLVAFGMATGQLLALILDQAIRPASLESPQASKMTARSARRPGLKDFNIILERNLFDSAARGKTATAELKAVPTSEAAPIQKKVNLKLLGTLVGGADPLALIASGKDRELYKLKQDVPGGGTLEEIGADRVRVHYADGSKVSLLLYDGEAPAQKATGSVRKAPVGSSETGIRQVGDNRWVIPRQEADKARSDLSNLMKTARVIPNVENGETNGFKIVMIQPKSFLDLLGLKRGDVLMQISGVELNSPEKALQVFQQLREANNLSLGLMRRGQKLSLEYEIN